MDINQVALTGNIGNELELRYTSTGTAVLELNLAVVSGFGDKKKTNWIGCTLWGKTAESAKNFLGKGRKIAVSGRLDQDSWEDKESGKKQSKTRVVVENWTFADSSKGERSEASQPARREEAPTKRYEPPHQPESVNHDEDTIPF